eukprot:gene14245-16375_t
MTKTSDKYANVGTEDGYDMMEEAQTENPLAKSLRAHSVSTIDTIETNGDSLDADEDPADHVEDELFGLDENSSNVKKMLILSKQSAPVVMSFFLGLLGSFINLLFAGRFVPTTGDRSIVFAGISLANMFANVSCLSLLIGMSSAVETLGSQHNGAGNYKKVGLVLQRSFLVLFAMTLPMLVLWYFVYDIYEYIGVEHDVCEVIKNYIYIRALGVPIDVINESYEKYLMSIGVREPSMWSNVSFNVFITSFNCLFVFGFGWGYRSLAFSWVLSTYLASFVQIGLSLRHPSVQRTLQPWDRRAWDDWWEYIQLGLPGTVMLCSEWWAFEILMLFATLLGTPEVAAQTIILQISSMAFMVPLGIGVTVASFVGNAIGAGKITLAKQMGKIGLIYTGCTNVIVGVIIVLIGDKFVAVFTTDPAGVSSGVLRGAGKQYIGAVANVIAYYGVGLPMAWVCCFVINMGVDGLIIGIAMGSLVQVTVLMTLILCFEKYLYDSNVIGKNTFVALKSDDMDDTEHGGTGMAGIALVQRTHTVHAADRAYTALREPAHQSQFNVSVDDTWDTELDNDFDA